MKILVMLVLTALIFLRAEARAEKLRTIHLNGLNTVLVNEEITAMSVDTMSAAIVGKRVLLNPDEPLYVVIVSGGGLYNESLKLKSLIEAMPNVQVICKYCASAASMIFATFPGPRLAIDKSVVLMHEMFMEHFTAKMSKNPLLLDNLQRESDEFNDSIRKVMGMSKEDYEKKIVGTEWTVKGREVLKLKLATEFVQIECDGYAQHIAPDTCSVGK